jgi:hypothetical protein
MLQCVVLQTAVRAHEHAMRRRVVKWKNKSLAA